MTTESSLDSSEKDSGDEQGLVERDLPKKTDRLPLRREGDRGNKIQQKFPSVSSPTKRRDVNGGLEEFQDTEPSDTIIPDSNKKLPVEQKSKDSTQTTFKTSARSTLIDPNEDLSIYLTKVPSVSSRVKKIGNDQARCRVLGVGFRVSGVGKENKPILGEAKARCQNGQLTVAKTLRHPCPHEFQNPSTVGSMTDSLYPTPNHGAYKLLRRPQKTAPLQHPAQSAHDERVENALKAHDLYFGWQRVVRQGILDIDDETENKVNRAISLVRRGTPIKVALKDAQVGIQVSSFLLAISTDDTEALAYLSANVARAVW